jgi:hypothetical protein
VGAVGNELWTANGFLLVALFLYFSDLFGSAGQRGGFSRVDAGRLQQGCRQILGGNWDETRFQIIFSIRPHEMYLGFSLHIITTLFSTNTHATASFRKDER